MAGPQMEIVADFLAGWYMARRASAYPTDAIQGMRSLYRKGDYLFNNPQHHGTPSQRAAAFVAGTNYMQLPISAALGVGRGVRGGVPECGGYRQVHVVRSG